MLAEQSVQITPFDVRLVRVVRDLQDEVRGLVSSTIIAAKLAMKPRTARHYLRRGEAAGLLFRPVGRKSGYSAMQGIECSLAVRDSIERQAATLNAVDVKLLRVIGAGDEPMTSKQILPLVDASWTTVKRRLQILEKTDLVYRPDGQRSGYSLRNNRTMRICAYAEALLLQTNMQPFHLRVLDEMRWRERYCDAVLSRLLAQYLEVPERSMRYYLRQLEGMNLVNRPLGGKAGYRLTDVGIALLDIKGVNHGDLN